MNWIDRIIAAFSLRRGYERQAYRQAYDIMKGYDAGNYDRPNQNWHAFNESAEMTDRYSRENVRARARDLERNSDIMQAVIKAYKRNVIGSGFRVQAKTGDIDLNKQLEQLWKRWGKKQNCDVTGTQSLNQMLRMAVERKKVDGGILFLKKYTKDGLVPFKLQAIEVDELDSMASTPKHKGNKVVGGIEYSKYNRAVGYYISQYDLDGTQLNDPIWVDAKDVIF